MGGKRPVSAARKGPVGDDVNDPSRPEGKGGQRGSVEMVDSGNMMKVQSGNFTMSGRFPQPDANNSGGSDDFVNPMLGKKSAKNAPTDLL